MSEFILYALAAIGAGVLLCVTGMLVLEWVDRRFLRREAAKQAEQTWQDTSARAPAHERAAGSRSVLTGRKRVFCENGATITAYELTPEAEAALSTNGARIRLPIDEPPPKPDPDLTTYIALAVPKTPSPTAKTENAPGQRIARALELGKAERAAGKVRAATKKRKRK